MLGNRIKELRLGGGMTLESLARRIDTTAATVQRLETGTRKLSVDWIERLSSGLGCDPGEIIRRFETVPVVGRVELGGGVKWSLPTDEPEEAKAPPGINSRKSAAIGPAQNGQSSMLIGYYYFARGRDQGLDRCINRLSVVQLTDGRSFIHVVMPSGQIGKWNLYGLVSPPITQVEIEWAAPVDWICPAPLYS